MYVRPRPRFRPRNAGSGNTPSLALEFNQLSALPSYVTFSRGTQAMQYGSDGTLQYAPNNLLTYSNQADNAAWTKSNSFVQTNLLTYSEQFDNANWAKTGGATIVANTAISPDGNLTADTVTFATTSDYFYQSIVATYPAGATYAFSIYVKSALQAIIWGGATPAGTDAYSIVLIGNGWYRQTLTRTFTSAGTSASIQTVLLGSQPAGLGPYAIWGAQLVQGSVPGDYRATTSAALPVLYADYNGALRARKLCEDAANALHIGLQIPTVIASSVYTLSILLKASERTKAALIDGAGSGATVIFDLQAGSIVSQTSATGAITSAGNGYYRCSATMTTGVAQTSLNFRIATVNAANATTYLGDGSSGIYIADAQLTPGYLPLAVTETTSAAVYGPRFDYDPVTKVARGLLIEEQRINLLLQSNDFLTSWSPTNITRTLNATLSPEGVVNGVKIEATTSAGTALYQQVTSTSTSHTFSVYVKQGTSATTANNFIVRNITTLTNLLQVTLNFSTGAIAYLVGSTGASVVNVGNGWWRLQLTVTAGITVGDLVAGYVGFTGGVFTAGDFLYAYGAQLEAGAFATSYIPTVASTATRNADSASITTLTPWFNAAAGTIFAQMYIGAKSPASYGVYAFDDGTTNNALPSFYASAVLQNSRVAAANVFTSTSAGISATPAVFKEALAYANADYAASFNGGAPTTQLSGAIPSGINRVQIGAYNGFQMNGHFQSLRYYPTRLPNASLQSITV